MPMDLYHATDQDYAVGEILPALVTDTFHHQRHAAVGNSWVEEALEAGRPASSVSRLRGRYAFFYGGLCVPYVESDQTRGIAPPEGAGPIRLYRVEFPAGVTEAPVCLVRLIYESQGDQARIERLVAEYWAPTLHYNIVEAIGDRMRVLERVDPPPPFGFDVRTALMEDIAMARRCFDIPAARSA